MVRILVLIALTVIAATPVQAEIININGTLQGDPLPAGFTYELSCLAFTPQGFRLEVVGKATSNAMSLSASTPPGRPRIVQSILFADRETQWQTEIFAIPPVIVNQGGKARYQSGPWNLLLGDVIGVGDVRWVKFRKGAKIEANLKAARLVLDTGALSRPTRHGLFDLLHGDR